MDLGKMIQALVNHLKLFGSRTKMGAFAFGCLTAAFLLIWLLLLSAYFNGQFSVEADMGFWDRTVKVSKKDMFLLICIFFVVFLAIYALIRWVVKKFAIRFSNIRGLFADGVWPSLVLGSIFTGLLSYLFWSISLKSWWEDYGFLERLMVNPGGIFTFFISMMSLLGIYIAVMQLMEARSSITSFAELVDKIEKLIKSTSSSETIHMMVLTPAMGCLVLNTSKTDTLWNQLKDRRRKISLTCLNGESMYKWFLQYQKAVKGKPKKISMLDRAQEGVSTTADILGKLQDAYDRDIRNGRPNYQNMEEYELMPIVVDWHELPKCYMVATSERAIVAMPFFLPSEDTNPFVEAGSQAVQMLGFETTDPHLVGMVIDEIKHRRRYIINPTDAVDVSKRYEVLKNDVTSTITTLLSKKQVLADSITEMQTI